MQVWLAVTRGEGSVGETRVVRNQARAFDLVERFAAGCGVRAEDDSIDAGFDPDTGRVAWFSTMGGDGPEARVEGPIEVEG